MLTTIIRLSFQSNVWFVVVRPDSVKKSSRAFNLQDPLDWKAFMDAGAHDDPSKCMIVVGNAVRWTLEILIEKGAVKL